MLPDHSQAFFRHVQKKQSDSALGAYCDQLVFGGYRDDQADDVGVHLNSVTNLNVNSDLHQVK